MSRDVPPRISVPITVAARDYLELESERLGCTMTAVLRELVHEAIAARQEGPSPLEEIKSLIVELRADVCGPTKDVELEGADI